MAISDRDTLAAALERTKLPNVYREWVAVVLEGWRPPAQEITTAAELDALPRGSAVRTRNGRVWQREIASGVEWWPAQAGWTHGAMTSARLIEMGPVTVVYVPTEEGNRG